MTDARKIIVLVCVITTRLGADTAAGIERFKPREGNAIEVWRITNDPTVRDHANYHNTQCWSPDGRYLCCTHYASDGRQFGSTSAAEVHLYDLHEDKDIKIDKGTNPRWANKHNWLFYRDGYHVSTELFGPDGYIEESIQHGSRPRHWWYEKGVPVKYTRGADTYVKDGKRWKRTR